MACFSCVKKLFSYCDLSFLFSVLMEEGERKRSEKEKASTASSETKLSIVTVYEDLEGHEEILSTEDVDFGV